MAKKNDQIIDKKIRAKLKDEILAEINSTVKEELVETVKNDVKDSFDNTCKEEIKETIKKDIILDIENSLKHDQVKLSRRKSFKIFRLNVYILILLAISLFLIYRLYKASNIEIKVIDKKTETTTVLDNTTAPIYDLNYYKDKYGYLLNEINITNLDLLKGSYEVKNISVSDKIAMAYKNLKDTDKIAEGIITKVDETVLKSSYDHLFNDGLYSNTNFVVDGMNFAYSESTKSYLAIGSSEKNMQVLNSIYEIKEESNLVTISVYVGVNINNKLYNVNDLENSIKDLNGSNIDDVVTSLSKLDYTFEFADGNFHLIKLTSK